MKITLTVEADLTKRDLGVLDESETLDGSLIGELMKVKSGIFENMLCGWITDVQISTKHRGKAVKTEPVTTNTLTASD